MAFNRNQSDFASGLPAAAWFLRTTRQPDDVYAWQGRRIYRAFKEILAYRTQTITAPTGRDITLSEGPTTIARSDLERLQTWIEQSANVAESVKTNMLSALAEAIRGQRMTSGAMTVILWFALSNIEDPPRYEEIVVPQNTIFPPLGVAPNSDPTGLASLVHWSSAGPPPASVPVAEVTISGGGGSGIQREEGSGWIYALAIGVPVLLAIIVGVWMYYRSKKQPTLRGELRELSERYGTLYRRESRR